jgi:hypothetical protein
MPELDYPRIEQTLQLAELKQQLANFWDANPQLPLTTYEQYMLYDDSPTYPMQFFLRFRFTGDVDVQTLRLCLAAALCRHPLLTASVTDIDTSTPRWVPSDHPYSCLDISDEAPGIDFPAASYIDISQQQGVYLRLRRDHGSWDLCAQFHHAVCDASGGYDLMGDLFMLLAMASDANTPIRLRELDNNLLLSRGVRGPTGLGRCAALVRVMHGVRRNIAFLFRPVIPMVPVDKPVEVPLEKFPAGFVHHFSDAEFVAMRRRAAALKSGLNNLLLKDLFPVMQQWRRQQGYDNRKRWLRIVVPISMRTLLDRKAPSMNVLSLVVLDREAKQLSNDEELLKGIDTEMDFITRHQLGHSFLRLIGLGRKFGMLKSFVRRPQYWATLLFSNLGPALPNCHLPRSGRHLRVAESVLWEIEFLPATRMDITLNFGISLYAGHMSVGLSYDSRITTKKAAKDLFDLMIARLKTTIQN